MKQIVAEPATVHRIGSVSYLNAKPLLFGLEDADDVQLTLDVPSKLLGGLRDRRFDVALLPIIDYQRMDNLCLLSSGGIASDGPTLTVRIFSKVPVSQIQLLACDTDSHTSVALARVVLSEAYGILPQFVDFDTRDGKADSDWPAMLLIGDKVVCDEPKGFGHQLDLGQAWKNLTGLPFVFAAWIARQGIDLGDLPERLEIAKRQGMEHIEELVQRYGVPRGWPVEIARNYLTKNLKYDIGKQELQAIKLFHHLAGKLGLVDQPVRAVNIYVPRPTEKDIVVIRG